MKKRKQLSPAQLVLLSFLAMIFVGTLLLSLPFSTRSGQRVPFETAIFTAVSASCVTGLIIEDTASYWSAFGQAVILMLIQVGGLGVITMALVISAASGKKIGFRQRWVMSESISAPQVGGILKATGFFLSVTAAVELLGAAVLSAVFIPQKGLSGVWYSVFHSISAFCNAGFDLMGTEEPFSSLTSFVSSPCVSLCICALILIGGLGFSTWSDIRTHGIHLRKYSLQSKLILTVSAILVFGGFAFMFFYEFSLPQWNSLTLGERICAALFQAVTPRTAGFNTVDLSQMSAAGQLFMLMLMLIGGAPGSTAGGFKMTTAALLVLCVKSVFQGKSSVNAYGRSVSDECIRRAAALFMLYIFLFLASGLFISAYESVPLISALFETGSAVATVGLSLSLTPSLSTVSHIILMLLMYFGRVGGLTLLYAVTAQDSTVSSRLPQERVAIG